MSSICRMVVDVVVVVSVIVSVVGYVDIGRYMVIIVVCCVNDIMLLLF